MDWDALRAEYVAGGVSQRALAERRGVGYSALRRRAVEERWTAQRAAVLEKETKSEGCSAVAEAPGVRQTAVMESETEKSGSAVAASGRAPVREGEIALRVRRKLLERLERMADEIPEGAVTELKTQDEGGVALFKLRDLTAAYKELTGDMELEDGGKDGVKVVVDV